MFLACILLSIPTSFALSRWHLTPTAGTCASLVARRGAALLLPAAVLLTLVLILAALVLVLLVLELLEALAVVVVVAVFPLRVEFGLAAVELLLATVELGLALLVRTTVRAALVVVATTATAVVVVLLLCEKSQLLGRQNN